MTEDVLNDLRAGSQFNEMSSTAMAENVRRNAFVFDRMLRTNAVVERLHFAKRNVLGSEKMTLPVSSLISQRGNRSSGCR